VTDQFARYREPIADAIRTIIDESSEYLDAAGQWSADLRNRLLEFATRGKMIRGSLVAAGAHAFGYEPDADLFRVAAAVELVQSFLLIHDDIMDEDETRRGAPAVFAQYRDRGESGGYAKPQRFGESMAICGGNVALLIAIESIASTSFDLPLRTELIRRLSVEIAGVGVAQMSDVANGHRSDAAEEEEILTVYRYKTGRYTFSLPLSFGALIAGASKGDVESLINWGELQGTVFQIRDDHLNVMEDGSATGKPVGSDIAADKQTLHRLKLFSAASGTRWEPVLSWFGKPVTNGRLTELRSAMEELGVLTEIDRLVEELHEESENLITRVEGFRNGARSMFHEIASFNRGRRS
jgi:geranylgeranyl diphosphate synthase type I